MPPRGLAWAETHQGRLCEFLRKVILPQKTTAAVNNEGVVGSPYPTTPYKVPEAGLEPALSCENRQDFSHREADAKSLLDEAFRRGREERWGAAYNGGCGKGGGSEGDGRLTR